MQHARIDWSSAIPLPGPAALPMPAGITPRRRRRGLANFQSGIAAEDAVARHYVQRGAILRERRLRTPEGEIDLVLEQDGVLVFVEVKRRASHVDSPVPPRQWRRLENAALHYMMRLLNETGAQPVCRFDVALAGPEGQIRIIENARSFDEH